MTLSELIRGWWAHVGAPAPNSPECGGNVADGRGRHEALLVPLEAGNKAASVV